jgi:CheY-like chemotaxis protein
MLTRWLSKDVELEIKTDPNLGLTRCDPSQIEQVIVNLVVNARDAMPKGGRLSLETANVTLDETCAALHPGMRPGNYVCLTVADTGCGMDAETQARIFEPFFTTKEHGEGNGLGLATVYGVAQQAGGHVSVSSEPGHGATFRVYFPRIEAEIEATTIVKPALVPEQLERGSERVLVVEDQDGVREVVCEILSRRGYKVVAARNAQEAQQLSRELSDPFDLIITDVIMPEMGGRELAAAIASEHPEIKVLFMSGYTDRSGRSNEEWTSQQAFIQKPFTASALLHKVREVLNKAKGKPKDNVDKVKNKSRDRDKAKVKASARTRSAP